MLFYLLPQLADMSPFLGALNVTRYITFRTAAASLTAFAISMLFGPWLIRTLRDFQIGQIIHALRVAVTGKAVGFGLYETLAVLGKERCLARIKQALGRV